MTAHTHTHTYLIYQCYRFRDLFSGSDHFFSGKNKNDPFVHISTLFLCFSKKLITVIDPLLLKQNQKLTKKKCKTYGTWTTMEIYIIIN